MNRNIPKRRLKGFTEPWKQRKLGEVAVVNSGKDYKHLEVGEIPVYGTGGYMISVNKALSYKNDAIGIGRKGTIDNPFILRAPFWTVDTLFYIFPKDMYKLYFLYNIFEKINWNSKDESSGIPSLSKKIIEDTIYLFPTIEEQKLIGSFFKKLDEQISNQGEKVEKLKNLKKAYLSEMFPAEGELSPKRRFKGFTKPWKESKLEEKVQFYSGLTYKPMDLRKEGTLVLRSSNIKDSKLVLSDNVFVNPQVVNVSNVKCNDIIMVVRNGSRELIGKHTLIRENLQDTVIGAFMIGIRAANYEFINVLFDTDLFKNLVQINMGATINQITGYMFSNMKFNFPSDEEQKLIGSFFKKLDDEINLEQKKLEKLKQLKQAYLEEMFV